MGRGTVVRAPALILALAALAPHNAEADYRFEDGVYLGPAEQLQDWSDALTRARHQQPALDACMADANACEGALRGLQRLLTRARALPRDRQIKLVNNYINRRRYRNDRDHDVVDAESGEAVSLPSRWSTLVEFMRRGGDCEDYATSKYQLLRQLDVPAADLRVVVVYDRSTREHHAILAVRQQGGKAWLLDSDDRIYRGHPFGYRFVYALNETSIWDHEVDGDTWLQLTESQPRLEEAS